MFTESSVDTEVKTLSLKSNILLLDINSGYYLNLHAQNVETLNYFNDKVVLNF